MEMPIATCVLSKGYSVLYKGTRKNFSTKPVIDLSIVCNTILYLYYDTKEQYFLKGAGMLVKRRDEKR